MHLAQQHSCFRFPWILTRGLRLAPETVTSFPGMYLISKMDLKQGLLPAPSSGAVTPGEKCDGSCQAIR